MSRLPLFFACITVLVKSIDIHAQISIETINVLEDNSTIEIFYAVDPQDDDISKIELIIYTTLEGSPPGDVLGVYDHSTDSSPITWNLTNSPYELDKQLFFRLRGMDEEENLTGKNSLISSIVFFEQPETDILGCDIEIRFDWLNFIQYKTVNSLPEEPYFDRTEILVYHHEDGACDFETYKSISVGESPDIWDNHLTLQVSETGALDFGETYCFRVRSFREDNDGNTISAKSNVEKLSLDADFEVPEKPFIEYVSVVGNNEHIELGIRIDDDDTESFIYEVFRADNDDADNFTFVGDYDPAAAVFVDDTPPDIDNQKWYYYVTASNQECPDELNAQSQILSSIFVNAEFDDFLTGTDEFSISISWEHYTPNGYEDNFQYSLYRYINENEAEIDGFSFEDGSYTDYLSSSEIDGEVYYQIRAEADLNGQSSDVLSNRSYVSFSILDKENISRAFRPDSGVFKDGHFVNRTFWVDFDIPPDQDHYSLKVFDRHGFLVHEETVWMQYEGWDGTLPNGEAAPAGPYVWELRFREPGSTDTISEKGVVNLVR